MNCKNVLNRDCSRQAHKQLNLDFTKTEDCVNESFSPRDPSKWGRTDTKNIIID